VAGDWIKMSVNLPDKPEVWQIAGMLNLDADAVVGKLLRVWAWFDAHTEDGNAVGVTYPLVDRVAGVTGFAEAMVFAGWLSQSGSVMTVPHFERHNGKTAKNRALTNERVAKHRKSNDESNAESNARTVTKTVTREEKRREDIEEPRKAAKRRGAFPHDFQPNEAGLAAAQKAGVNVARELEAFRDHHVAKGSVMADWQAAWRTWVGNAVRFGRGGKAVDSDDPYGLKKAINYGG
jgi:hypothetical protein